MGKPRTIIVSVLLLSFALLLAATAPSGTAASGVEWVAHDTAPIDRLVYAYAQLPDGRIFIAAGADVSDMVLDDETWIYDPQAMLWEQVADCPYSVESSCSVAMPDGNVYLFGGMDGPMLENALIYDVADDTWSEGPALPTDLLIAEAVAMDDHRILIAGGLAGMWFSNCTKQCWIFDTVAGDFTAAADMPVDRCCGMMAAYDGKAYYFGGMDSSIISHDDIFAYDMATDEWSTVGQLPTILLNAAVAAGEHGNIYLIGGVDFFSWYTTGSIKAYSFDTLTGEVSELPDLPSPVLNNAAFMLDDGRLMYMLGNNGSNGNLDIFTLQTGEADAALSSAEVDQGDSVWLHIWVETDQDVSSLSGSAYLTMDNITYGEWHFSAAGGEVMVELPISEDLPAGEYAVVIEGLSADGWWLEWHFGPLTLTVADALSTQERLDGLEAQNQAMQDKLDDLEQQNQDLMDQLDDLGQQNQDLKEDLETANADLKDAVDAKLDAMIGYVILIVALGALIVGVVILVRKK